MAETVRPNEEAGNHHAAVTPKESAGESAGLVTSPAVQCEVCQRRVGAHLR